MEFNKVSRFVSKKMFWVKKYGPDIALAFSTVTRIAAFGFAIKNATRIPDVVDTYNNKKSHILDSTESKQRRCEELKSLKNDSIKQVAKLLVLPITLEAFSIATDLYSHASIRKRYKGALLAYSGLAATLASFESRVIEGEGLKKFNKYRYGIDTEEVAYSYENEDGEIEVGHEEHETFDETVTPDAFAKWFEERSDEYCPDWSPDPAANRAFLMQKERWLTEKLRMRGYLWLNEVYKELGLPETELGWQYGWVYDEENPVGDNFVDFGIFTIIDGKTRGFIDRENNRYLLVFNVDGLLYGLPQLRKCGVERE